MSGSFSRSQQTSKPGVTATSSGVVAAQHICAAKVGAEVLAAGGDAVDAAVAVSFAIGVLEPWMSGPMGGGAMMLWRADEGRAHALNYGMRASATLDLDHYPLSGAGKAPDIFSWQAVIEDRNVTGATSIAVPGTMAGISAAHGRFGRFPWAELLAPSVTLARAGLHIDWYAALVIASSARDLARDPDAAAMFLDDGQWPKGSGWTALSDQRLDQSKMADPLDQLGQEGDPLTDLLRKGAGDLLQAAVEAERDAFLGEFAARRTSDSRAAVVGSGYHPEADMHEPRARLEAEAEEPDGPRHILEDNQIMVRHGDVESRLKPLPGARPGLPSTPCCPDHLVAER